jgi:hypothetical protein
VTHSRSVDFDQTVEVDPLEKLAVKTVLEIEIALRRPSWSAGLHGFQSWDDILGHDEQTLITGYSGPW